MDPGFYRCIQQYTEELEKDDKAQSNQLSSRQGQNLQPAGEDWMIGLGFQPLTENPASYNSFDSVTNNASFQFQPPFSTASLTPNIVTPQVQQVPVPAVNRTSNNNIPRFQFPRPNKGQNLNYTSPRSQFPFPAAGSTANHRSSGSQLTFPTTSLTSNNTSSRCQLTFPSTDLTSNNVSLRSQFSFPATGPISNNVSPQWQPSFTTSPSPARLSLAPRNTYHEVAASSRTLENANNYFRQDHNPHQGTLLQRRFPRHESAGSDTIHSLTNGTLPSQFTVPHSVMQSYTGYGQSPEPTTVEEPFRGDPVIPAYRLDISRDQLLLTNQLREEAKAKFQATLGSSSPVAGIASSPTARVSLRRASHATMPRNNLGGRHAQAAYSMPEVPKVAEVPQTPQRQNMQQLQHTPRTLNLPHAPPMAQGIQIITPQQCFADQFRHVFPYQSFNAIQSKCFPQIYNTNDNIVVSAPTGSGKTVLLEMAICKVIRSHQPGHFKIVYQAPTKSLCSERLRDWEKKFSYLGLAVAELTGDTSQSEMFRVRNASIIVTTPEKWDSITRKLTDHVKLVKMVKLFLIDEVHMLKDIRGATLEAVVSRMKSMGNEIRFVAISATVPNSNDIATWLGKDHANQQMPAHREEFGETFRPVRLVKHVRSFDGAGNAFGFDKILDGKLPAVIQQYSEKKPIMVFCFTRKSCENTARILSEHWTRQKVTDRAWPAPAQRIAVLNEELQNLVICGVAFHHAGLDSEDRNKIETAFLRSDISVICCTSTLAVGVNLPCHLVILKGTVSYQDGGKLAEYSDLDVMQMLGRAGRPQFDSSAVAVIMTRSETASRYDKLISGQQTLESTLHRYLIEHLNSEISLGFIKNLSEAQRWIHGTFLAVRMKQNPDYYKMDGVQAGLEIDRTLELVCERDIKLLQEYGLVSPGEFFRATEYGLAMSRCMVPFETSKAILALPKAAKMNEILQAISQATEFDDLRMKPAERPFLRDFNNSPLLKYPLKDNVKNQWHKIYLMIQVQLGGLEHPPDANFKKIRRQFATETSIIFERAQRLVRFVIDCKASDKDALAVSHGLDLLRSLSASFWENSNLQLRQIPKVGPAGHKKLVAADINSVEKLLSHEPAFIEMIMSRQPPYGQTLKTILQDFPRLVLKAEIVGQANVKKGKQPIVTVVVRLRLENKKLPVWLGRKPSITFMAETAGRLAYMWRGGIARLENKVDLNFDVDLQGPADAISCRIACDEIVGTLKTASITPNIPASAFPPLALQVDRTRRSLPNRTDTPDEFGDDGLGDDEMLDAARNIETASNRVPNGQRAGNISRTVDLDPNDFADIDSFEQENNAKTGNATRGKNADNSQKGKGNLRAMLPLPSTMLPNGRWTCNHTCRAGLKNGKPCKHKCCTEGLEKKPRKKASKIESGSDVMPSAEPTPKVLENSPGFRLKPSRTDPIVIEDTSDTELVDLSELLPQNNTRAQPLSRVQEPVRPLRAMPRAFYSGDSLLPPLFDDDQYMSLSDSTNSTPSGRLTNFDPTPSLYDAMNTFDDSFFGSVSPDSEVISTPHQYEKNMMEDESLSVPEAPQPGSKLDTIIDPFKITVDENPFEQDFEDPNFNNYIVDNQSLFELPSQTLSQTQLSPEKFTHPAIPSFLTAISLPKRPLTPNRMEPTSKYPRLSSTEPAAFPAQLPRWTTEVDSGLIEELQDYIEFEDNIE